MYGELTRFRNAKLRKLFGTTGLVDYKNRPGDNFYSSDFSLDSFSDLFSSTGAAGTSTGFQ